MEGANIMKCGLCHNDNAIFIWKNVPGCEKIILCDNCAKTQLKGWLEDNGPENSAEAASHYKDYQKLIDMLNNDFNEKL
jgi:protein-arginine kinase activator protein McsA